jgi:hypothetical protein
MHGSNPHGQGNVSIVDINPSNDRPLDAKPDGSASGEDVIVGRGRGEKDASGNFHGHITIAALFGNEIAGVNSTPGQANHGPLQSLQTGVLDPLCQSTGGAPNGVCLSVLKADSTTTTTGSTNDFAVARASLLGLNVGAAESAGNITQDPKCQTALGSAKTVNVTSSTGTIAGVANSQSVSRSCAGAAPQVSNTSQVINLGGTGVPLPAAGCANGTPDTETGIPGLLPIICNAEEIAGAAGARRLRAADRHELAAEGDDGRVGVAHRRSARDRTAVLGQDRQRRRRQDRRRGPGLPQRRQAEQSAVVQPERQRRNRRTW